MRWKWLPYHEKLSMAQAKRELKALNIDIEELPLIKISDAVLIDMEERGISIKVGDIIKISRNSKVAGEGYEYYRRVVL
jgi:DNA-directed RNA polymerase subunit H (RpoH/RPB5)|tara:strand:+ start:210 stop:446 length:237 start_codon:yes stop_codon:yes gene_type:complete